MRSKVCTFLAILLCTSAATRAFAAASLTPLGDLPGGTGSVATGVSGDGSVVVGISTSASSFEAFRWTSDGGMVALGYLPGGGFYSEAWGVSGDGSVVVGMSDSASGHEAFRWTSGGGMVSLGDLPGGGVGSGANGVSADGSVIVGYGIPDSNDPVAVRWTSDGGMVGLGTVPGGVFSFDSVATGVSADGSVVVGHGLLSTSSSPRGEAFRWTSAGGMVGLGYLPGGIDSGATGVSGDGSVIVGYNSSNNSVSDDEAFRWTSAGGMVGLGTVPGRSGSRANGVSGDGSIVVGLSYDFDGLFAAFYWTADGGMRDMWDLLLSHGVDPAADGWTELVEANGISADGSTIVGTGIRNGNVEAFVAVIPTIVPEPAAAALALLGVSSILLLLRRRSLWRPNKLKALHFQALAGALTLMAAAPAAAIDTEPLNNSQLTADSLPLLPGTAISNFARLGGAGGDVDFFQTPLAAGEVLFGMVTPLAGLPTSFTPPDTVVSVFDDTGARTFNEDDDAGELADIEQGYGSVFRFLSPAAADYRIGVSGSSDYEFDGAASGFSHSESGGYVLTVGRVNPAIPGGGFTDTDHDNQTAAGADLIPLAPGTARVAVAELTDGDVDFFRLDLKAGNVLSAMTAPLNDLGATFDSPDTLMGLFDSSGTNLLVANDDSGGYSLIFAVDPVTGEFVRISPDLSSDFPGGQFGGFGSALRALIPADGTYYLAVTGFGDDRFTGAHGEFGAYALLVGVAVPEPGSVLLAAIAIAACGLRRVVKQVPLPAQHRSRRSVCAQRP